MAKSKNHITPENITEWLASTGYLFPRNEVELSRFEKLYGQIDENLTGREIDPDKIINNNQSNVIPIYKKEKPAEDITPFKMVARKGNTIPENIMDKIKRNQDNRKKDDPGSKEEEDK